MNQIYDQPNEYDFGLDFDYSVWPIDTRVDLINVPWNNDYRDIVRFASKSARDTWMDGRASTGIRLSQMSYVKPNEPVRIDTPFNRAIKYNYLRAQNPVQPNPGDELKSFYYFILDVRYIGPFTTELVLQLDAFQTYGYDVTFGNCYVERGHIGVANANQFNNYGRDYLTVPEGLDTGSEYDNVWRVADSVITQSNYSVIAVSSVDLLEDAGTVDNPILNTANGSNVEGVVSGATYYVWNNQSDFRNWLVSMREKPWVTQGILTVMVTPKLDDYGYILPASGTTTPTRMSFGGTLFDETNLQSSWRDLSAITSNIPPAFRHLKKLWTYPYMAVEMTMYSGTPIIIKPDSWMNDDMDITKLLSIVVPGAKIVAYPDNYNSTTKVNGENLNFATQMGSLPQVAIVNDGAISYLSANKNTIAYQRSSADWAQQRALGSAQAQYDIAGGAINSDIGQTNVGISADAAQTGISNTLASQQALVSGLSGLAGGTIGGAAFGPAGAVLGAVNSGANAIGNSINTGLGIAASQESFAVRNSQALQSLDIRNRQSQLVRDTNKGLADWAAKGDYANNIAAINAKVQDAQLIQPSISGQSGGDAFLVATQRANIYMTIKMLPKNAMNMVCNYWLRYGYAIQRFISMPSSLMVMDKFTYWKLSETYITSSLCPESFKQVIRGIFEKGVTVWANPDDIGNISIADNTPLGGISY